MDIEEKEPKRARLYEDPGGMIRNVNTTEPKGDLLHKKLSTEKIKPEQLIGMTPQEFEQFLVELICSAFTYEDELGILRQKVQHLENRECMWRKRALALLKQTRDLKQVVKCFLNDSKTKDVISVIPPKVTISVGVQVSLPTPMPRQPATQSVNPAYLQQTLGSKPGIPGTPHKSDAVNFASAKTSITTNQLHSSATFTPIHLARAVQPQYLPVASTTTNTTTMPTQPASLPVAQVKSHQQSFELKKLPPIPEIKLSTKKHIKGILTAWNLNLTSEHEKIAGYEVYVCQARNVFPSPADWMKAGEVIAQTLPMACVVSQVVEGHKYYFSVRAVDIHSRFGPFCSPESIVFP